uniref:Ig-like domain-containing protein n=1 Tax=Chelydra serpentina TaxID=8475 RepID=A0A8C3XPM8_CHESE
QPLPAGTGAQWARAGSDLLVGSGAGMTLQLRLPAVLAPTLAIHVYTHREVHGTVGSQVTLACSFWSSEWISEDVSITWLFQPENGKDTISIFHFVKGQPYVDEVGAFKNRMEWVGDPHRKDGSIIIRNLDYTDNGTFTCDVKNPPDIGGKSSQVTLYVFEKGTVGRGSAHGPAALKCGSLLTSMIIVDVPVAPKGPSQKGRPFVLGAAHNTGQGLGE